MVYINPCRKEFGNGDDETRGHEHFLQCTTQILSFSSSPIFFCKSMQCIYIVLDDVM